VKVAVVAPAATEVVAGKVAAALLELSAIVIPPVGAAAASVTVPVEVLPPTSEVGFKTTDVIVGALTASVAV